MSRPAQREFTQVAFRRIGLALGVRSPRYQLDKAIAAGVVTRDPKTKLYRIARFRRLRKYARENGYKARRG